MDAMTLITYRIYLQDTRVFDMAATSLCLLVARMMMEGRIRQRIWAENGSAVAKVVRKILVVASRLRRSNLLDQAMRCFRLLEASGSNGLHSGWCSMDDGVPWMIIPHEIEY